MKVWNTEEFMEEEDLFKVEIGDIITSESLTVQVVEIHAEARFRDPVPTFEVVVQKVDEEKFGVSVGSTIIWGVAGIASDLRAYGETPDIFEAKNCPCGKCTCE